MTRLKQAIEVTELAGEVAQAFFDRAGKLKVDAKAPNDLVSEADQAVETFIRKNLNARFETHGILGEEGGGEAHRDLWIVDPIDGTSNFLRSSPLWGISLAYAYDHKPTLGVLHFPKLRMTLSAGLGQSVVRNGEKFTRPDVDHGQSLVAIGDNQDWDFGERAELRAMLNEQGFVEHGFRCCSVGMAFAALGHVDAYVERHLSIWDLAAGLVICQQAGLEARFSLSMEHLGCSVVVGTPNAVNTICKAFPDLDRQTIVSAQKPSSGSSQKGQTA